MKVDLTPLNVGDRAEDCLHCSERAPGSCILLESDEAEYYCQKHEFSPRRPAIIEVVKGKLDRDPAGKTKLKEALMRWNSKIQCGIQRRNTRRQ